MSRNNKTYTEEYKRTLVNLIVNGKTISEVSREYGVATSNLVGWKKLYSNLNTDLEENITLAYFKKMQKEFAAIKEECDILKKALKIFAKN
jgi:transposase